MPISPKWIVIAVAALVVLLFTFWVYNANIVNPRVAEELVNNPDGERAAIVTLLTLPDGKQLPVNYLRENNKVFLGADGSWWRAFRDNGADVTLWIRGKTLTGHAVVVLDDPNYTHDVFARLRPKAPSWLPDWLNGKLIVITLDDGFE